MHLRCPHCHNPIEVLNDQPLHDVCCPSCGSSFSLISGGSTQSYNEAGRTLGHFQLIEQLGAGHFGTVWKARDIELDRVVAIKIPRKDQLTDTDTELFFREARAAAQLRHPNIVSVHEVGRADDTIYIASDYIEGCNLKEWLSAQKLTFRESAELCITIANALHHAHELGVIHRDLKPGNILMGVGQAFQPDPNVRHGSVLQPASNDVRLESLTYAPFITDFGLAKRESGEITMTVEGQILGTPAYMSPEQARGHGHQADRRSDIYSLGVILFELLTGELPFRGETRMLIVQILKDEPPSPRKLNARIPRDLETITLKCLSKDPARRYPTAAEVAADLQRHLRGEPILARPVSQAERLVRWCRRNPMLAVMMTTIATLLVVGTSISTIFAVRSNASTKRADENARTANRNLYVAKMNLAQTAWEGLRVAETVRLLESHRLPPVEGGGTNDLRNFEWYYWDRLAHSDFLTLGGISDSFLSVAFSPDGRRLAAASNDGTVKVWDALNGQELLTFNEYKGKAYALSVAFSPDGKRVAAAIGEFKDQRPSLVRVWDTASGQETLSLKGQTGWVKCVAFSPDGKRLATASSAPVIWDAASGQELLTLRGDSEAFLSVVFSPDGKQLAAASADKPVKVWDATSGELSVTLKPKTHTEIKYRGDSGVAFSPDGKRLASAGRDGKVKVSDSTNGEELVMLNASSGYLHSVAFSPDGRRLAVAAGSNANESFITTIEVKVWDSVNGRETLTLSGHDRSVRSVVFSPDGKRLASASEDGKVKVWDAIYGQKTLTLEGHSASVMSVAVSPDGNRLASGSKDGTVKVWDAIFGQELLTLKGHSKAVVSVTFSPDGKRLASADRDETVKLWDAMVGRELLTLNPHQSFAYLVNVVFSPDGQRLALASWDKTVKVLDCTSGGQLLSLKGHTHAVFSVAFSPVGSRLASASEDGTVKLWDATSGQELHTLRGDSEAFLSVVFSQDGRRLAAASNKQRIKVWDAVSGELVLTLENADANSVAFSPDGKRLAAAIADKTVKMWDVISGQETITLKGHTRGVTSVTFSRDGQRLASASNDGTVKVWDARPWTPELRAEREALSVIRWLQDQGRPQSDWLAAIAADQTISEPARQRALQFAREWKP